MSFLWTYVTSENRTVHIQYVLQNLPPKQWAIQICNNFWICKYFGLPHSRLCGLPAAETACLYNAFWRVILETSSSAGMCIVTEWAWRVLVGEPRLMCQTHNEQTNNFDDPRLLITNAPRAIIFIQFLCWQPAWVRLKSKQFLDASSFPHHHSTQASLGVGSAMLENMTVSVSVTNMTIMSCSAGRRNPGIVGKGQWISTACLEKNHNDSTSSPEQHATSHTLPLHLEEVTHLNSHSGNSQATKCHETCSVWMRNKTTTHTKGVLCPHLVKRSLRVGGPSC